MNNFLLRLRTCRLALIIPCARVVVTTSLSIIFAFLDPVAIPEDYKDNKGLFDRGHLTPNADFGKDAERDYTMVTTNIAPQVTGLDNGNWAALESALRSYAKDKNHKLYVITGTGKYRRHRYLNLA